MAPEGGGVRRLLISEATSYKAVVLAAFIKRHYPNLQLFTCDSRRTSRVLHTRFTDEHVVLSARVGDGRAYKDELLALVHSRAIDLYLPIAGREMELLLPFKSEFGEALAYLGGEAAFLALNRKDRLQELARECGIRAPETFQGPGSIRPPAVAKPIAESAARGVVYLGDSAAVERFLGSAREPRSLIIQEHVFGSGVGYSVFARNGTIVKGYAHRRLAEYPVTGGSSVYRESCSDGRLEEICSRLLARTRWSGFAMFEFKQTPSNELYLLEANPRVWGSINQGLQNGVNYLEPLLGPIDLPPRGEARTYLPPLLYPTLALYALRGDFRPLGRFVRNWRSNRADLDLVRDPTGWLSVFSRLG